MATTDVTALLLQAKGRHPARQRWLEDEARMRASFLATRRHLAPFLVPHRFEDNKLNPEDLRRAKYGYGIGLNKAWLGEIIGHVAGAGATYRWGALAKSSAETTKPPTMGVAAELWRDATRDGNGWSKFFNGTVLEWMLSSPGGVIVADVPSVQASSNADARAKGKRPFVRFAPWSSVEDLGTGPEGLRWIQFAEVADQRKPGETRPDNGLAKHHVLYELAGDGTSTATRIDDTGKVVGKPATFGKLLNRRGRPTLPVRRVRFGEHPDLSFLGAGLLLGLDDIVIDLFNLVSEAREGFRDACFGIIQHVGPDGEKVKQQLDDGTRFLSLGDTANAGLTRLASDPAEAATGIEMVAMAVRAWALAARRKAQEAQQAAAAERSGISLVAEFQLDVKPLLVSIAGTLDDTESDVMYLMAQLAGEEGVKPEAVGVTRSTEFRLEDEASRISRIVGEVVRSLDLPAAAIVEITMRWLEASGLVGDLDRQAGEGATGTVRDQLRQQLEELATAKQQQKVREREGLPDASFGAAA